jgi:hypothetical protein
VVVDFARTDVCDFRVLLPGDMGASISDFSEMALLEEICVTCGIR